MSLRFSTGFANALAGGQGYYELLKDGYVEVYSGSQPTTPDNAINGTLLFTARQVGTYVAETKAIADITFTGAGGGSVTSLKIGGVEILAGTVATAGSANQAALDLAASINSIYTYPDYYAEVPSSAKVVIYAPKGSGSSLNNLPINMTFTTCTATTNGAAATSLVSTVNSAGAALFGSTTGGSNNTPGVPCSYGLTFTYPPSSATLTKSGTWQGTAVATGTAGWFRLVCGNYLNNVADAGGADTSYVYARIDGTVGISGTDMTVASTSVTSGAVQTINTFSLTLPTT